MNNNEKFLEIQNSFKDKINFSDNFNISDIKTVAGVDLAYCKK